MTGPTTVRVVATGSSWTGNGVSSIYTVTEKLISHARKEIHVTAYALGQEASAIVDLLESKAREGVEILIVVNRLENQPLAMVNRLRGLQRGLPTFDVYSFGTTSNGAELHAKLLVVDRREALVASSNLSWHGLVGNHELGILVQGAPAAKIARLIDKLAGGNLVRALPSGGEDERLQLP